MPEHCEKPMIQTNQNWTYFLEPGSIPQYNMDSTGKCFRKNNLKSEMGQYLLNINNSRFEILLMPIKKRIHNDVEKFL